MSGDPLTGRRVAIVGGGIGGLTLARALACRGIDHLVLERAAGDGAHGAGLQLAPNATRELRRLGLGEALAAVAVRPARFEMRDGVTGRIAFTVRLGDELERRFGAPLLAVRRGALRSVLMAAAASGTVRGSAEVAGVRVDSDTATVTLRDGTALTAELVAGADGIRSAVRRAAGLERPLGEGAVTVFRGVVPAGAAEAAEAVRIWSAPDRHCVMYATSSDGELSFSATVPFAGASGDPGELLRRAYAGWSAELLELFAAARSVRAWPLYELPSLARLTAPRVALLGDAAHAMLPYLAQGAACAIEDAVTLAGCLAQPGPLEAALARYEALRHGRGVRLQTEAHTRGRARSSVGVARVADATAGYLARHAWIFGFDAEASVSDVEGAAVA